MQITQELIDRITVQNRNWWIDIRTGEPLLRNVGEMIALVHSELSEAFEGWLNNSHDDKLPQYLQFDVEIIDAVIRGCDIAGGLGISGIRSFSPRQARVMLWDGLVILTAWHGSERCLAASISWTCGRV